MPQGKFNTLVTIIHRNQLFGDSAFSGDVNLRVPAKTSQHTELEDLIYKLKYYSESTVDDEKGLQHLFFPYASACYSFNPQAKRLNVLDTVAEQFREGKWGQPCIGELFRIQFYLSEACSKTIRNANNKLHPDILDSLEKFDYIVDNNYISNLHNSNYNARGNTCTSASDGNSRVSNQETIYCFGINLSKKPGATSSFNNSSFNRRTTVYNSLNIALCEF